MIKKIEMYEKVFFENPKVPMFAIENFLEEEKYKKLFEELQSIPMNSYDRYENIFEKKYTLQKKKFPIHITQFLEEFESIKFLEVLSRYYPTKKICIDTARHYWGVHKFGKGDLLAIHADAGIHPFLNKPKFLTIGLYMNSSWDESMQGTLEIWDGESLKNESPCINTCMKSIKTKKNTLIMFENSEYAWHGAPNPYQGDIQTNPRYFVTVSLLLDEDPITHFNKRKRAYFAKIENIDDTEEISELRKARADDSKAEGVYRMSSTFS